MQKIILSALLLVLLFSSGDASEKEEAIQSIQKRSNEIVRLFQEMVHHGGEGHTDEIVLYGEKAVEQIKTLTLQVQSDHTLKINKAKKGVIASLELTLKKTNKAIQLGKADDAPAAYEAARAASFQAKKTRQQIHALFIDPSSP
jgi:hypothetical protein